MSKNVTFQYSFVTYQGIPRNIGFKGQTDVEDGYELVMSEYRWIGNDIEMAFRNLYEEDMMEK